MLCVTMHGMIAFFGVYRSVAVFHQFQEGHQNCGERHNVIHNSKAKDPANDIN